MAKHTSNALTTAKYEFEIERATKYPQIPESVHVATMTRVVRASSKTDLIEVFMTRIERGSTRRYDMEKATLNPTIPQL